MRKGSRQSTNPVEEGLINHLIAKGRIKEDQLGSLLEKYKGEGSRALLKCLELTEEEIGQTLGEYFYLPPVILHSLEIDLDTVHLIPEEFALRHLLIPFEYGKGVWGEQVLKVAVADPANRKGLENLRIITGFGVEPFLAHPQEILEAIHRSYPAHAFPPERNYQDGVWTLESEEAKKGGETARLVNSIIYQAIAQQASDIHWEPQENDFSVRYRIDGKLFLHALLPLNGAETIISRIKIMAKMDVTEHRASQDGSFVADNGQRRVDLRVSSLPTVYGEKMVMRILDPDAGKKAFHMLGFSSEIEEKMRHFLRMESGMLLIVGPTGSGKTTTLYALLQELNHRELNIVSIEDPIEYRIPGINQVSVNLKTGLTFAKGLRAILRQDPDVMMIGEIRDEETARIGITASLTGHLVFSTLHTKTAVEAITRLKDMSIEPYLLATAITGVLSQRLILRLCEKCKRPLELNEQDLKGMPWFTAKDRLYQPVGCGCCRNTGYRGRVGIHELLLYDKEIKDMILSEKSPEQIEQRAKEKGMIFLWEDAVQKAKSGITSVEQVMRFMPEEERK